MKIPTTYITYGEVIKLYDQAVAEGMSKDQFLSQAPPIFKMIVNTELELRKRNGK